MKAQMIRWMFAATLIGCGSPPPPQVAAPEPAGRKAIPQEACEAQGGTVVGDIGDGATHRPDYVCPSGKSPLGDVAPPPGGPIAIEGSVCCPR